MTTTPSPEYASTTATTTAPTRTLSILSLVAAIAAVPLGHFFILPIAAIVLGFLARGREPWARTMSTWGIALGFVILFWWAIVGMFALAFWLPISILHFAH
jgi:riboflavin transporter FmnP